MGGSIGSGNGRSVAWRTRWTGYTIGIEWKWGLMSIVVGDGNRARFLGRRWDTWSGVWSRHGCYLIDLRWVKGRRVTRAERYSISCIDARMKGCWLGIEFDCCQGEVLLSRFGPLPEIGRVCHWLTPRVGVATSVGRPGKEWKFEKKRGLMSFQSTKGLLALVVDGERGWRDVPTFCRTRLKIKWNSTQLSSRMPCRDETYMILMNSMSAVVWVYLG